MHSFHCFGPRAPRFAVSSILAATALLVACGDDGGAPVEPDAGPMDLRAPELVSTNPLPNERGVSRETVLLLQFDESMDTSAGTVVVQPGDLSLAASSGTWFEDDTRLQLRPAETLGAGVDYEVVVDGFRDVAGNLAAQSTLSFQTADEEAPVVESSTPSQGAMGLSARLDAISITFSEPMDQDDGEVDLQGGPRSIGPAVWTDERTVTYDVDQLAYERTYELFLFGFRDRFGNTFDDTVYLDEGVLRFDTGVDDEAPFVASSTPMEGAMEVNPSRTSATLSFVEPMDTSVLGGVLFVDGAAEGQPLEGRWNRDGTRLTFEFQPLGQERDFRIDLADQGHADVAGNPLDLTTYLLDGALDFSSGLDTFPPTVVATSIADGAAEIEITSLEEITVTFNEAMDTAATTLTATEVGSGDTAELAVTWTEFDRVASIDPAPLRAGFEYTIDLTTLSDPAGNAVAPTVLDDGALGFTTADPTGETCRDPLNVGQATLADGVYTWELADDAASEADGGGETCDSTEGDDLVLEYTKTSNALSAGGRLLRVTVVSTEDANVEVAEGLCDPRDDAFESIRCEADREATDVVLDVGPGTYFIYVSHNSSFSGFPAMTVEVEEIDAWPAGESCGAPYDVDSTIYTAPETDADPHVWLVPQGGVRGYDRSPNNDEDPVACGDTFSVGHDAVIEFEKAADDSVLEITVENLASSSLDDLTVDVSTTCDPTAPDRTGLACVDAVDGGEDTVAVTAGAGPVYVWLLRDDGDDFFPETRVSIREVAVGIGEACSRPRVLASTGANAVTLDSGERFGAPSCFPATGDVTWFGYTAPADGYVRFLPDGVGAIALVDADTAETLVCGNADFPVTPARFAAGQELCIGIANDASISQLDVAELTYDGLEGTVTDPLYERAVDDDGDPEPWTADIGMAATPTTLYLSETTTLFALPKAGGDRALEITELTSSDLGDVIIARGEELFGLDDTSSSSSSRVSRLWDGFVFPWEPEVWDTTTPSYPSDDMTAMAWDGTDFVYGSNDFTEARFYRVSATRPGEATQIGVTNTVIEDVVGLAADDTWIWYIGQADLDAGNDTEGLFRIRRADLANGSTEPEPILVEENLDAMGNYSTSSGPPLYLDDVDDPDFLYVRTMNPNAIHVIADPDGAPLHLGTIVELGGSGDFAWTLDRGTGSLYLFESETTSDGRIVKID